MEKLEEKTYKLSVDDRLRIFANYIIDRILLDYKKGVLRYNKLGQKSVKKPINTD